MQSRRSLAPRRQRLFFLIATIIPALLFQLPANRANAVLDQHRPKVVYILAGAPFIGFYNEGTDYRDHEDASPGELARHREREMSLRAIPADERRALQDQLRSQEEKALEKSFTERGLTATPAAISVEDRRAMSAALFHPGASRWDSIPLSGAIRAAFQSAHSTAILLIQVDEVSHGEGRFIVRKAMAHYFCVDAAVRGRVLMRDGTMTSVRSERNCRPSLFHPEHTEQLHETAERQEISLHEAFDSLLKRLLTDGHTKRVRIQR